MGERTAGDVKRGAARLSRALPKPMGAFAQLHAAALSDGALDAATKELMALTVSIAQGCSGCIAYHGEQALSAGAGRDQYMEAVGVAVLMAGGPGSVYGAEALDVLERSAAVAA